ncbi:MAG: peptide chain release factor N(5)-glutamine methyltransferase [Bacteroidales bacterium]|nr:peptide chain release factor N(5)-glutamine methyltransferase [Bacteroidales bacterium]
MPNTTHMHIPSNRVRDIERYIRTELDELYPEGELRMFTQMLFEAYMGWSTAQLLLHRDDTINQSDLLKFHWAVEDLKQYRPIQHIIGYTDFCDCRIAVSPDVLIPRPETEEIVLRATELLNDSGANVQEGNFLDLCTGSGCIAIALAKQFPKAKVYAVDISTKALDLAQKNAERNHVAVEFVQSDILQETIALPCPTFDLIISNPPYIQEKERCNMERNVLEYEPSLALFVPDKDPLKFYRAIGLYALQHLTYKGLLILEIDEHLGSATCQLLQSIGFVTQLLQDFRGKDRSIIATPKP